MPTYIQAAEDKSRQFHASASQRSKLSSKLDHAILNQKTPAGTDGIFFLLILDTVYVSNTRDQTVVSLVMRKNISLSL